MVQRARCSLMLLVRRRYLALILAVIVGSFQQTNLPLRQLLSFDTVAFHSLWPTSLQTVHSALLATSSVRH
ncbi:hypothetical protein C8J56DRAFT_964309 [Mycena floridula]|nr:hypothetical protein C8J56DRAFT_964309 [Mycena floridula]